MYANSAPIVSAQTASHQRLAALVSKHASTPFQKPIADYNRLAFDRSIAGWRQAGTPPLILDAGCGVGLSTLHLATQFPDHFVIGVDQSADRLGRNIEWSGPEPANCAWVRADLVDYWRLMHTESIRPARHYLLYPNPWPKIGQLQRRWHAHPVFPTLLALGGYMEWRSNWRIYIDECCAAVAQLTGQVMVPQAHDGVQPITPFERKYQASGHALWRCSVQL